MKKWLDEEYEFQVEVTGYLHGDTRSDTAATARRSVTSTVAPTAVR